MRPTPAPPFSQANEVALQTQMQLLTQLLHRKVFKPVRREVDGRKDLDKRISDRKKVIPTPTPALALALTPTLT